MTTTLETTLFPAAQPPRTPRIQLLLQQKAEIEAELRRLTAATNGVGPGSHRAAETVEIGPAQIERLLRESPQKVSQLVETMAADLNKSKSSLTQIQRIARMGIFEIQVPSSPRDYWSEELFRIFGRDPSAGVMPFEEALRQVVHEEDRHAVADHLRQATENRTAWDFVFRIAWPDGSTRVVRTLGEPIIGPSGAIARLAGVVHDITETRQLEQQLRQAQKMEAVGKLAGGIAHDFNNMLTVINGYGDLLLSRFRPDDPSYPLLLEIRKAGERTAALTRQLLAFSRRTILTPVVLDLNSLIADMDKMLRRMIGEDIDLVTVLAPDLGRVKADPSQLEQVIVNLLVNARDAMPTGGNLTVETRNVELDDHYTRTHQDTAPGHYALIAVSDTGTGMPPEVRARIFEPFFTTKEVGKGTGLGLATVYGIVKQSGGSIEVYSEEGRGSTFKVYLPRLDAPLPDTGSHADEFAAPGGAETVLLVEDEAGLRDLAAEVLRSCGYTVLTAASGPEALERLQTQTRPVQLLLTDVVMPKMSGQQLAGVLSQLYPGVGVLYMSGYTDDAIVRHGVLEPGVDFIQKPFTPALLVRKVRDVLDRHGQ